MAKITKTEEQLTKDLEAAMKKLYKTLLGTQEEKIQILRSKFENELQQLIQLKQTKKISKKKEPSEEMKAIIDLLRHLTPHAEIAERYGRTHSAISKTAEKNGIYSLRAVRKELRQESSKELSNEELATKMGVYPEAIERIRQELEKENQQAKKREKATLKPSERPVGEEQQAIEEPKEVVLTEQQIREKLAQQGAERMSNAVWARWTGVHEETIARIREELEKGKKNEEITFRRVVNDEQKGNSLSEGLAVAEEVQQEEDEVSEETEKVNLQEEQGNQETQRKAVEQAISIKGQVLQYGRKGMEIPEIAERLGVSKGTVSQNLRESRIWSAKKIRKELKQPRAEKKSDDKWASITGVDVEAIRRIRKEIKDEEPKPREKMEDSEEQNDREGKRTYTSQNTSFRERLSVSRNGKLQIVQEPDETELEAKATSPVVTYQEKTPEYPKSEQELAEKLGISVGLIKPIKSRLSIFPAVSAVAKEYKVSREIVEKILEIVKKEQYDRTHTVVQYKSKMMELRSSIAREVKSETSATALEYQVDTLAREFTSFLMQNDYVFLAYGYAKARKYEKAIQLGEEHLGLDTPSISGLERKIQELVQRGLDDKEKQEVAKTFKIFGKGNEDER